MNKNKYHPKKLNTIDNFLFKNLIIKFKSETELQ